MLDLFADISLVAKFFIIFFDASLKVSSFAALTDVALSNVIPYLNIYFLQINNPDEDREMKRADDTLLWIRLALTLGGSLISLVFLFFMTNMYVARLLSSFLPLLLQYSLRALTFYIFKCWKIFGYGLREKILS